MTILTVQGLATYLSVSESSAYKIIESGQLPTIYIGSCVRIIAEEVDAYLIGHRSLQITVPTKREMETIDEIQ